MNLGRRRVIDRAREVEAREFSAEELQNRIREICREYLIEAKVDVARLLRHPDWQVRYAALNIVWWGLAKTDGIEETVAVLLNDPEEEVRSQACSALYEASKGTPKIRRVIEVLRAVAASEPNEYVRENAATYTAKLIETTREMT